MTNRQGIRLTFGRPQYTDTPDHLVRITVEVFERDSARAIDISPLRRALEHVQAQRLPAPNQESFAL